MVEKYFDKNGKRIEAGMILQHVLDKSRETVYSCEDEQGRKDLGFNASNENWLARTGRNREIYPLYQFNLADWEIV